MKRLLVSIFICTQFVCCAGSGYTGGITLGLTGNIKGEPFTIGVTIPITGKPATPPATVPVADGKGVVAVQ